MQMIDYSGGNNYSDRIGIHIISPFVQLPLNRVVTRCNTESMLQLTVKIMWLEREGAQIG